MPTTEGVEEEKMLSQEIYTSLYPGLSSLSPCYLDSFGNRWSDD